MSRKQFSDLDFGGVARVTGLPSPVSNTDATPKSYVDSAVEGLAWKDSVRVAATANVNLASPGASIDGIAMVAGDRFLAPNQTAPAENNIYVWNGAAVPATAALDVNSAAEVEQAITTVEEGTSAGVSYRQTAVNVTLGTTALSWTVFGASVPPASQTTSGIAEIATQAETDTGTDDVRIVTPNKLANWSGRVRQKTGTVGDGSATQFDITHNFNTRAVLVTVYRNSTPWDDIGCDVSRPDANTVRLNFATAPSASQFAYVIHTGGTP